MCHLNTNTGVHNFWREPRSTQDNMLSSGSHHHLKQPQQPRQPWMRRALRPQCHCPQPAEMLQHPAVREIRQHCKMWIQMYTQYQGQRHQNGKSSELWPQHDQELLGKNRTTPIPENFLFDNLEVNVFFVLFVFLEPSTASHSLNTSRLSFTFIKLSSLSWQHQIFIFARTSPALFFSFRVCF
eukprot:m.195517 g.195517  ORF g.195517 m.195517 type:complete len:183 (-) comp16804_c0_seq2:1773-2321(-)